MKTVAVLGGLGYIGSYLIDLLVRHYNVVILDAEIFGKDHLKKTLEYKNVKYIKGNVCSAIDLTQALRNVDYVINLAGLVGDPACSLNEEQTWLYNTESSHLIADICNYCGVEKLIYASSCSVYGAAPSDVMLNEGSYLNPVSLYAKTKIDSENIFFNEFNGITGVIRLATVFGYSKRMRFDLVANLFTIKAIKEGKLEVYGGTQYRPFIHCLDAARAFKYLIDFEDVKKIDNEVFNICCENISIRELGELVSYLKKGSEIIIVDQKEDNRNYRVDASKIKWLLGYEPMLGMLEGVQDMIDRIDIVGFDDWDTNDIYYNHKMCGVKL